MADTRELVLQRLLVLVADIENIRFAVRNEMDIPDTKLPAVLIFDADEETNDADDVSMRGTNKPIIVHMTPEIVVVAKANEVGSDITTLRKRLLQAVLFDEELNTIVRTGRLGNGAIRYLGCETDLGYGRSLQGGMSVHFSITYSLDPNRL